MKINTHFIRIEDCFKTIMDIVYDIVVVEDLPCNSIGYLIEGLSTPGKLYILLTKDSGLPSLGGMYINLESLEVDLSNGIDSVLIFTKGGKPFHTILYSQCN